MFRTLSRTSTSLPIANFQIESLDKLHEEKFEDVSDPDLRGEHNNGVKSPWWTKSHDLRFVKLYYRSHSNVPSVL